MKNIAMSYDAMNKDDMSRDSTSESNGMKKHDAMGKDHPASGAMVKLARTTGRNPGA
jgi:hypothetical protein